MKNSVPQDSGLNGDDASSSSEHAETAGKDSAVHEQVFLKLRDLIISGQLSPGETLSVRGIAKTFDVSTMPARDAIRRLAAAGAIEFNDTRRIKVARIDRTHLEQIRFARLQLEPEISRHAVRRLSKMPKRKKQLLETLDQYDQLLDQAINAGDIDGYARHNSAFHFEIYRAAESTVLMRLVEDLWLQLGPTMRTVLGRLGTSNLVEDRHKEAMAALRDNDEDALAEAIHMDIREGLDSLRETVV